MNVKRFYILVIVVLSACWGSIGLNGQEGSNKNFVDLLIVVNDSELEPINNLILFMDSVKLVYREQKLAYHMNIQKDFSARLRIEESGYHTYIQEVNLNTFTRLDDYSYRLTVFLRHINDDFFIDIKDTVWFRKRSDMIAIKPRQSFDKCGNRTGPKNQIFDSIQCCNFSVFLKKNDLERVVQDCYPFVPKRGGEERFYIYKTRSGISFSDFNCEILEVLRANAELPSRDTNRFVAKAGPVLIGRSLLKPNLYLKYNGEGKRKTERILKKYGFVKQNNYYDFEYYKGPKSLGYGVIEIEKKIFSSGEVSEIFLDSTNEIIYH